MTLQHQFNIVLKSNSAYLFLTTDYQIVSNGRTRDARCMEKTFLTVVL